MNFIDTVLTEVVLIILSYWHANEIHFNFLYIKKEPNMQTDGDCYLVMFYTLESFKKCI